MKFNLLSVLIFTLKRKMLRIRQFEWMDLICSLAQITVLLRVMGIVIIDYTSPLHAKSLGIEILVVGKNIKLL